MRSDIWGHGCNAGNRRDQSSCMLATKGGAKGPSAPLILHSCPFLCWLYLWDSGTCSVPVSLSQPASALSLKNTCLKTKKFLVNIN